ncbi:MAG: dockerin type I repeat-containing protein [Ruminococcus sp.]
MTVFNECKNYYTENNSYGAFIYGFDSDTLYSSCVLPSLNIRYVTVNGRIRSVSHNRNCSYALYNKVDAYYITELDSTNGNCVTYSFGELSPIDNSSFAFCGGKAYFIFTDSYNTYVRSYDSNGNALINYTFDANVKRVFTNDSKVYVLLFDGDIYRLDNSSSHYCINVNSGYDFYCAGSGYIYSESGILYSLTDNNVEYINSAMVNCVVKSENKLIYSDEWTIKYNEKYYKGKNKMQSLFFYRNNLSILYESFTLDNIKLSDFKENDSKVSFSNDSANQNEAVKISSDGFITGISSGTTVTNFKKLFSDEVTVYDKDGNEVTSGKIKTGYLSRISDVIYEISVSGDITGEGNVKSNDVSALMSYFVGKSDLSGVYLTSADFNNDGSIDNKDLVSIARRSEK